MVVYYSHVSQLKVERHPSWSSVGDSLLVLGKRDGGKDWGWTKAWRKSHGFIYYPSMIKNTVESQNVQPLKPINKEDDENN